MKKILITGGAGYIGSTVANLIQKKNNYKIFVIDDLSTGNFKFLRKNYHFSKIDLKNKKKLEFFFKKNKIDAILHFAASISVEESELNPKKYYNNNVNGTKNLIDLAIKHNINNIIFASTASVYGKKNKPKIKENEFCRPVNVYGKTKLISENYIKKKFILKSKNYIILRFFNVVGSSLDYHCGHLPGNSKHLVKNISTNILKKKYKISVFGNNYKTRDGTCIRDYIHVQDLAKISELSLKKILKKKNNVKKIINCGYGKGYSVLEIIKSFEKIIKRNISKKFVSRRLGDPPAVVCDNNKIKKFLNWKPKYNNLEFMLKNSLNWYTKFLNMKNK